MKNKKDQITAILYKHLKGFSINHQEQSVLDDWLLASEENPKILANIKNPEQFAEYLSIASDEQSIDVAFEKFKANAFLLEKPKTDLHSEGKVSEVSFRKTTRTIWLRYAAAVLVVFSIGFYFLSRSSDNNKVVQTIHVPTNNTDVKAPTVNRATITLAGGQQIFIDSTLNGTLTHLGHASIHKNENGEIIYQINRDNLPLQYNLLSVPRGSQIASIVLSDGTKAYLNVGSSLKYPVAFPSNIRQVEVTGEVYFEVAKDLNKKFIVTGSGLTTEVLGTHFNINTYGDDETMRVTLLEGSVKVSGGSSKVIIKPGYQAIFSSGLINVDPKSNVDQVMSWKNGVFNFDNKNLKEVMRQLERWYDIEVIYGNNIPVITFGGKMGRDLNLSQVTRALEVMGVKFKIEGRQLYVGS